MRQGGTRPHQSALHLLDAAADQASADTCWGAVVRQAKEYASQLEVLKAKRATPGAAPAPFEWQVSRSGHAQARQHPCRV